MIGGYYILDGHEPVVCDEIAWACRNRDIEGRRVASTQVADASVSTIFLGSDYSFGSQPPLFFETMIFGGEHDEFCDRYSTWDDAQAGHDRIVNCLEEGREP